jgi:hypothetical protein
MVKAALDPQNVFNPGKASPSGGAANKPKRARFSPLRIRDLTCVKSIARRLTLLSEGGRGETPRPAITGHQPRGPLQWRVIVTRLKAATTSSVTRRPALWQALSAALCLTSDAT